jgi:hypothetical protein
MGNDGETFSYARYDRKNDVILVNTFPSDYKSKLCTNLIHENSHKTDKGKQSPNGGWMLDHILTEVNARKAEGKNEDEIKIIFQKLYDTGYHGYSNLDEYDDWMRGKRWAGF